MWYIINVSSYSSSSFSSSICIINYVVLKLYLLYIPCIKVPLTATLPPLSYHLHQPYWLALSYWELTTAHTVPYENIILELPPFFLDSWPLKMGPICWSEMSVRNYRYSLCNNPEEHGSYLHMPCLQYKIKKWYNEHNFGTHLLFKVFFCNFTTSLSLVYNNSKVVFVPTMKAYSGADI
jgi:hypothetical protein